LTLVVRSSLKRHVETLQENNGLIKDENSTKPVPVNLKKPCSIWIGTLALDLIVCIGTYIFMNGRTVGEKTSELVYENAVKVCGDDWTEDQAFHVSLIRQLGYTVVFWGAWGGFLL
jgi:hypothetical protein